MPGQPVTADMLDPATPPEVEITSEAPEPVWDPTLGIAVQPDRAGTPRHRLVALGDSLTQGFQSLAVFNTHLSFPAIIAYELGWLDQFRRPTYEGFGGLPLNLEYLLRELEHQFGERLDWWELPLAPFRVRHLMAQIEDWWERGPGAAVPNQVGINHNLAVYGWDLRDTLDRTFASCQAAIGAPTNQLFRQIVEHANERAALRVLAGAPANLSPLGAAASLGAEGSVEDGTGDGIETLVIALGANNALGAVTDLQVNWSGAGYDSIDHKSAYNVWNPVHFQAELDLVAAQVRAIAARHTIWCTVPHVTIAPIARGVGGKARPGSRYYPFYTHPWIATSQFRKGDDKAITGQQARAIDSAIDQYNQAIVAAVRDARRAGRDWYLLDVAGLLDRLAARRYFDDPLARPDWWQPYPLPPELAALDPVPDSRFFRSGPGGRTEGGLFSLDGVHPTTIGYGILAQEVIDIMQRLAGVTFNQRDGVTARRGPVRVDFGRLLALDTLIAAPPISLGSDLTLLGWCDQTLDLVGRFLRTE